ncbi:hypothetical protein ANCDUO_22486 [Ancylostoma duodenale]|uniref:Uncharacterized protein n=1 Tax=Ancylostoma duodenale TaxID=51022 RepID=A0A0C2BU49_9BILA|nr:hypothetical protein ANCDUO_22486 [Ancylostoma duodenale]
MAQKRRSTADEGQPSVLQIQTACVWSNRISKYSEHIEVDPTPGPTPLLTESCPVRGLRPQWGQWDGIFFGRP